jgi:hypothetical protein
MYAETCSSVDNTTNTVANKGCYVFLISTSAVDRILFNTVSTDAPLTFFIHITNIIYS